MASAYCTRGLVKIQHTSMHRLSLLQRRTQRAMQAVLEIKFAVPQDDVREQVAVEGGILLQQRVQVEGALGGHQLIEAHLLWCD